MTSPFAAIETSINQRAIGMLANADADFGGGLVVSGIFDSEPIINYEVQSNSPQFQCLASTVTSILKGAAVTINAVAYTVKAKEPDGAGFMRLELTKA